jgi:hypothetical protein
MPESTQNSGPGYRMRGRDASTKRTEFATDGTAPGFEKTHAA